MTVVLGVDIGGTFTDFVLVQDGILRLHKQISTPDDPSQALLEGINHLDLDTNAAVIHGSTVATNALLEYKGARTALITTAGFADIIEIGRQDRPDLYALVPARPDPLVPEDLRFEANERVDAAGGVLQALTDEALQVLVGQVSGSDVESLAVCLLFSFKNDEHEQQIRAALEPLGLPVTLSSELAPEYREYERASTVVINAYVRPLMERYLTRVQTGLNGRRLLIMQSNGGVIDAATAGREAARTALSGPSAGAVGAFHTAGLAGIKEIITFDMGGTSTDVAVFPGRIPYTREALINGMPLTLPVVDIHTVGAGGGSIARVDEGGALRVGPQSAGANPGPACYGRGDLPTTSDANLVLGRLQPDYFLGGGMSLDVKRAREAVASLTNLWPDASIEQAALGVVRVANANMERAIRTVSIERGFDPRVFTLVAFGGAGPLHACDLATSLHIPRVFMPRTAGVLSALGMTVADLVRDGVAPLLEAWTDDLPERLERVFADLEENAASALIDEGLSHTDIELERALDMRYAGQSHEVTVTDADADWLEAFHAAHHRLYGHRHDQQSVEVVAVRVRAAGSWEKPDLPTVARASGSVDEAVLDTRMVWFAAGQQPAPVLDRTKLLSGHAFDGPAIIVQLDSTAVVPPGWHGEVDEWGNILLS